MMGVFESLEQRICLAQTIVSAGPITRITIGEDNALQVHRIEFSSGQIFSSSTEPADGGFFVRFSDGTVNGFNGSASAAASATQSLPFTPVSQTLSGDGLSITSIMRQTQAPGGAMLELTQTTSYKTGDNFFHISNRLKNASSTPLTIDAFAAADIFLADSDRGVGFHDAGTGAVGGINRTGNYHIFFQPDPAALAPSHFQESVFSAIWSAIGAGGHFSDSVRGPTVSAPFDADPNYIDNGIGLEWQAVTIPAGATATVGYYAGFGSETSVTLPAAQLLAGSSPALGAQTYDFTVRYTDETGVDATTTGDDDIIVTGPNGFSAPAMRVAPSPASGSPLDITYRISAPSDGFDAADNGTYTVSVNTDSVRNIDGIALTSGAIGVFDATLPSRVPNLRVDGPLIGKFPAAVVGGAKAGSAAVKVTNDGQADAKATISVAVFASKDAQLNETDDAFVTAIGGVKISLRPSRSKTLKLRLAQYPGNLPDDSYFLIARVDSTNALPEPRESDNNAVTLTPITIAAPFVDLSASPVSLKGVPAPGVKVSATILAHNAGNVTVKQSVSVEILASPGDSTLGNGDVSIAAPLVKMNLKPAASKNTRLAFAVPADVTFAPGTYALLAVLDSPGSLAESDEVNNVVELGQLAI